MLKRSVIIIVRKKIKEFTQFLWTILAYLEYFLPVRISKTETLNNSLNEIFSGLNLFSHTKTLRRKLQEQEESCNN